MTHTPATQRVLCVWLPNWAIQRVQAAEPELAESPLILSTRDPRRGLVVAAANLAARAAGVRPTMRLSEATAIVEAVVREHDADEDLDALCNLAEQGLQFSPIVGLEALDKKLWAGRTLHQPEALLLDVTGIASLFGDESDLLAAVSQWLEPQNYFGCMAIANSVGAAWAMANYGTRQLDRTSDHTTDAAATSQVQRIVPSCRWVSVPDDGMASEKVAQLSLMALRIPAETLVSLQRLGLKRIGDLNSLPRAGLATRLGTELINRWDQAQHGVSEPIQSLAASVDWQLHETLEFPTEHRETMLELIRRLCHELCRRLERRGTGALRLVCRLDLVEHPAVVMQLGLFRPSHDAQHLTCLLSGQLEQQLRGVATVMLWRMSLQATLTAQLIWRQGELFQSGELALRHEIARLVDTLSSRLGRKRVLRAGVRRETIPEAAAAFQPLTGRKPSDGSQQTSLRKIDARLAVHQAEPQASDPLRRPMQLLTTPLQVDVAGTWHERSDGSEAAVASEAPSEARIEVPSAAAPARIQYQGNWHQVRDAIGPERLESGWWKGPSVRRDYYRVQTDEGQWWWIFRDLNQCKWFVHGHFD